MSGINDYHRQDYFGCRIKSSKEDPYGIQIKISACCNPRSAASPNLHKVHKFIAQLGSLSCAESCFSRSPHHAYVRPASLFSSYNSKIQIMYSIRYESGAALAQAVLGAEKGRREMKVSGASSEDGVGERRARSLLVGEVRVQKEGSGRCAAPRTRGERSGKEMRKSVINWR